MFVVIDDSRIAFFIYCANKQHQPSCKFFIKNFQGQIAKYFLMNFDFKYSI
jgi:hypothetical protein